MVVAFYASSLPMNVQHLRKELDTSSGVSYTALDKSILISSGSWTDVGKTALSVYDTSLRMTVHRQVFPVLKGLDYWMNVKNSNAIGIGICWLQNFPLFLRQEFNPHKFNVSKLRPSNITQHGWNSFFYLVKSLNSLFKGPVIQLADENTRKLEAVREEANETVGKLLECWAPQQDLQTTIAKGVDDIAVAVGIPSSSELQVNEEQVLQKLQAILDHINKRPTCGDAIPPFWIRWWPALLIGSVSGTVVLGSWRAIANWFSNNVVETTRLFLYNWVYEPLYQIYLTVRHDPTSQVALMGKESLKADLDSLQRMVVEFAKDNSSHLSIDSIKNGVTEGNLGPVMRIYEKEIETPVKSLLSGKLIRSLLIQLQKTKVDAEIAVSGINQLIQSQQLVFGIIAATPALAVLYLLSSSTADYINGTSDIKGALRNQNATKDEIMVKLGRIEEIALDNASLDYRNMGAIYCIVAELQAFTSKTLSPRRHAQFCQDLDRIVAVSNGQKVVEVLLRIYAKY